MENFKHLWKMLKSQNQETKYPVHNHMLGWILVQSLIKIEWQFLEKLAGHDYDKVECDEKFQISVINFKIKESGNKIPSAQLHVGVNTCAKFNRDRMKTLREVSQTRLCLLTDGQTDWQPISSMPPNFIARV